MKNSDCAGLLDSGTDPKEEIEPSQHPIQRRQFLQAAAVAGVSAGDEADTEITAQQDRLLQVADRGEDDRWAYETTRNLAHVRSGLVNAGFDSLCEKPSDTVETYAVGQSGIHLGFEVSTDNDESVGTLVYLSAEQAEALAVDLLEQAHVMRDPNDD